MVEPLEAVFSSTGSFGDARYKAQPTKVWTGHTKYKNRVGMILVRRVTNLLAITAFRQGRMAKSFHALHRSRILRDSSETQRLIWIDSFSDSTLAGLGICF